MRKEPITENEFVGDLMLYWLLKHRHLIEPKEFLTEAEFIAEHKHMLNQLYNEVRKRYGIRHIPKLLMEACVRVYLLTIGKHLPYRNPPNIDKNQPGGNAYPPKEELPIIWDVSSPVRKIMENIMVTDIKKKEQPKDNIDVEGMMKQWEIKERPDRNNIGDLPLD